MPGMLMASTLSANSYLKRRQIIVRRQRDKHRHIINKETERYFKETDGEETERQRQTDNKQRGRDIF